MRKLGTVILIVLLVLAVWQLDFLSLIESLKQMPPRALAALLVLQIITQLVLNYQWCRIGRTMGEEHNFWKMLYVNARGAVVESLTPGVKVGGEVTRAVLLRQEMGYSGQKAATLVTIQKVVSLTSFFLVNLFAFTHLSSQLQGAWGGPVRAVVYAFLLAFIGLVMSLFTAADKLYKRAQLWSPKQKWKGVLQRYFFTVLANIEALKGCKGELYKQFGLSLFIWLLFPVKMLLLVRVFTAQPDPIVLAEITFISYMVGMIPLLPGGLGSFEGAMTSLLMAAQIESHQALAITLIFRFVTFWFVMLISLAYYGFYRFRSEKG